MSWPLVLADPAEELTVTTDARDRRAAELAWPKVFGVKVGTPMTQILQSFPESAMGWLCWHAAKREGQYSGTWADLEPRLIEARQNDDEGQEDVPGLTDPTHGATSQEG